MNENSSYETLCLMKEGKVKGKTRSEITIRRFTPLVEDSRYGKVILLYAKINYFIVLYCNVLRLIFKAGLAIIETEIEIAIEIGKLPEIDFDHDFDFDHDSERSKCENNNVLIGMKIKLAFPRETDKIISLRDVAQLGRAQRSGR